MADPMPDLPSTAPQSQPQDAEPLLVFVATPKPAAPPPLAVRCPCCGLRSSRPASDESLLCSGQCAACGGPCLGVPLQEPARPAPPLAVRPTEDSNWVMRN